jgi:hypothetical protein
MMVAVWGGVGWIVVAFVGLLLPPLGMITGLRLPAIQRDMAGVSGPLSPGLLRPQAIRRGLTRPPIAASASQARPRV